MTGPSPERELMRRELLRFLNSTRKYRKGWSFANTASAWIIVISGSAAAILAHFDFGHADAFQWAASVLSMTTVIFSTAQLKIGFERKWASYRRAHTAAKLLHLELEIGKPASEIREQLKAVYQQHDDEIIGH